MKKILVVLLAAFLFRLFLFPIAHHGDLNNNISWGNLAVQRGLNGYYEAKDWEYSNPNQPPLTILTFAATSFLWKFIEDSSWYLNNRFSFFPSSFIWFWESKGMDLMVKLPGMIADLVIGFLIYKFFKERGNKKALLFSSVWLFNPIVWYNSAIWGQTDPIVNLLGFASILFIFKKDLVKSLVFLTLSILFKGSLSLFVPIVLAYAILQKYPFKKWLISVLMSLVVIVITSVWFHPKWDLFIWLVNLYKDRIFPGEIGYLTANSFNFWWLVNPGKVLDSTIFLGLSARSFGIYLTLLSLLILLYQLKKKPTENRLLFSLAVISLVSFLFMTRIHERYLYPFFLPATILLGSISGLIVPYIVLTIIHLLNLYHLFYAPGIPILEKMYLNPIFPDILSYLTIIIFVWILLIASKPKFKEKSTPSLL